MKRKNWSYKQFVLTGVLAILFSVLVQPVHTQNKKTQVANINGSKVFLEDIFHDEENIDTSSVFENEKHKERISSYIYGKAVDFVLHRAAEEHDISYTEEDLMEFKRSLASRKWTQLQESNENPEKVLKEIRKRAKHLRKALQRWKKDKEMGKQYFKKYFQNGKLGGYVSDGYWYDYTAKASDESFMEKLRKKENMTRDRLHLTISNTENRYLSQELKKKLFDVNVSEKMIHILWNLLHHTTGLTIKVFYGRTENLKKLKNQDDSEQATIRKQVTSTEKGFKKSDLVLGGEAGYFVKLLSVNEVNLKEGRHVLIEGHRGADQSLLIEIQNVVSKQQKEELSGDKEEVLRQKLYKFQINDRFLKWKQERVKEAVTVIQPEIKEMFYSNFD